MSYGQINVQCSVRSLHEKLRKLRLSCLCNILRASTIVIFFITSARGAAHISSRCRHYSKEPGNTISMHQIRAKIPNVELRFKGGLDALFFNQCMILFEEYQGKKVWLDTSHKTNNQFCSHLSNNPARDTHSIENGDVDDGGHPSVVDGLRAVRPHIGTLGQVDVAWRKTRRRQKIKKI